MSIFLGKRSLDLEHVQADEIKVKTQSGWLWMAMAMMVSTRLWLGGAVSAKRNRALIDELVAQVRSVALCRPLLLARRWSQELCEGLPERISYATARGQAGSPPS